MHYCQRSHFFLRFQVFLEWAAVKTLIYLKYSLDAYSSLSQKLTVIVGSHYSPLEFAI